MNMLLLEVIGLLQEEGLLLKLNALFLTDWTRKGVKKIQFT